ncbi:MAG: hypothetical protein EBZ77_02210, partial [Chitinophagia bacterium]|nr:hypothetical protein [Chitinophagia bacterium]
MINCTFCGFTNEDGARECMRCHSSLVNKGAGKKTDAINPEAVRQQFGKTISGARPAGESPFAPPVQPTVSDSKAVPGSATVKDSAPENHAQPAASASKASNLLICPNNNCRYPNRPDANECVNCGTTLAQAQPATFGAVIGADTSKTGTSGTGSNENMPFGGTIRPETRAPYADASFDKTINIYDLPAAAKPSSIILEAQ